MLEYEDTTFQQIVEKNAIPEERIFTSEELNFDIAFALYEDSHTGFNILSEEDMLGYVELKFMQYSHNWTDVSKT